MLLVNEALRIKLLLVTSEVLDGLDDSLLGGLSIQQIWCSQSPFLMVLEFDAPIFKVCNHLTQNQLPANLKSIKSRYTHLCLLERQVTSVAYLHWTAVELLDTRCLVDKEGRRICPRDWLFENLMIFHSSENHRNWRQLARHYRVTSKR